MPTSPTGSDTEDDAAGDALARCVGDTGRFVREHWARAPLYRPGADGAGFADLLSLDVRGRRATALLARAERHGQPDRGGGVLIPVRLTHRDLAGMVGASRENVSRALAGFRRRGLLDYGTESIRLIDQEALRRLL